MDISDSSSESSSNDPRFSSSTEEDVHVSIDDEWIGILNETERLAHKVYQVLGAGYSETVYQKALESELRKLGNVQSVTSETVFPIFYLEQNVGFYRLDLFVHFRIMSVNYYLIIEMKTVQKVSLHFLEQGRRYLDQMQMNENFTNSKCVIINMPCIPDSVQFVPV